ncbi:MAG: M14 family metallocarboxypeptidase, partial [bacterium]
MIIRMLVLFFSIWLLPYVCLGKGIQTPLERDNYAKLSSHSEMMEYLKELDSQSDIVTLSSIGQSVQGRDIPALFFSLDKTFGSQRLTKLLALVYCQQHGNEPSGKEAALVVARNLVNNGKTVLKNLDLIIVPQVNPDGAEMGQRKNANDMDLNRNHVILSEPEIIALHSLFLKWKPEVTLDVHEYNAISKEWISNGYIKDAEEMLDGVTNLNIASSIIKFSREVFIPEVGNLIQQDGFRFHRYIVGSPFENKRIRHSTTAINDGRQSMGIYNTLSFILEGKRDGDLITNIERRTNGQISAITAFLNTVASHRTEIMNIVRSAREKLLQQSQPSNGYYHVQMDYFSDPAQESLTLPVFDLYKWDHVEKQLENYKPLVRVKKSIVRPHAYVFSQKEERLIDLLSKHEIKMSSLRADTEVEVEIYTILHVTPT